MNTEIEKFSNKRVETQHNSFAFTLAEVLITLAIIGVVAAMTMPTLITKYKDKEFDTRYKKAKYVALNGFKLMMAHNNVFSVTELPIYNCTDAQCYADECKREFKIIADSISGIDTSKYIEKYYKSQTEETAFLPPAYAEDDNSIDFNWDDVPYVFQVQDGMLYGILSNTELKSLDVYVDVNSVKDPNRVNRDLYKLRISGTGNIADVSYELEESAGVCYPDMLLDADNNGENIRYYSLSGCKTKEACEAVKPVDDSGCVHMNWCGTICCSSVTAVWDEDRKVCINSYDY